MVLWYNRASVATVMKGDHVKTRRIYDRVFRLRVKQELYDAIKAEAERRGITMSQLTREAFAALLGAARWEH